MKITKISPQKKKGSDNFNIFIDGKYSFSLSSEDVVRENIKIGEEVSLDRIQKLKYRGSFAYVFNRMLNFISFRPRSETEVRRKLKDVLRTEKNLEESEHPQLIDEVVEKLKNIKLLNDKEFGQWLIKQRQESVKPRGLNKIRSELYSKGLDRNLIDELLSTSKDSENSVNEEALAEIAATKKLKSLRNLDAKEFKKKLSGYLLRQGFSWSVVSSVVDSLVKTHYNNESLDNID